MKRVLQLTGILVSLLLLVGVLVCAFTPREKLLAFVTPELTTIRVTDIHLNDQIATMQVHFNATSKILPVFIRNLTYDFRLYGVTVVQGSQDFKPESKKGQVQQITLPVSLNQAKILGLLKRPDTTGVSVSTYFQASCDLPIFGRRNLKLNQNLPVSLPVLPTPTITNVTTQDFGFQHQRLVMTLAFHNPNNFDLYLRHLKMNVQLNEYAATASGLPKSYLLKARQTTPLIIPSISVIDQAIKSPDNLTGPYTLKIDLVAEPLSQAVDTIRLRATTTGIINH